MQLQFNQNGKILAIINFANGELATNSFLMSSKDAGLKLVQNQILQANRTFPEQIDEGIVLNRCFLEDGNLVYDVSLDPDLYDISILQQNGPENMKAGIAEDLDNLTNDPVTKQLFQLLEELGMGLCYRYSSQGQHIDAVFTSGELRTILNK